LEVTPDGIPHDEVAVAPHRSRRVAIEEDAAVAGVERSLDLGLETRQRQPLQMRAVRTRLAGSSGGKRRRFISMRSPPEPVARSPAVAMLVRLM